MKEQRKDFLDQTARQLLKRTHFHSGSYRPRQRNVNHQIIDGKRFLIYAYELQCVNRTIEEIRILMSSQPVFLATYSKCLIDDDAIGQDREVFCPLKS